MELQTKRETFDDTEMVIDEPEEKLDVAMESQADLQMKQEEDFQTRLVNKFLAAVDLTSGNTLEG